jgi:hypothetical protein
MRKKHTPKPTKKVNHRRTKPTTPKLDTPEPVIEKTIADKLNEIQAILHESGLDSSSQIQSLAKIREVLGW